METKKSWDKNCKQNNKKNTRIREGSATESRVELNTVAWIKEQYDKLQQDTTKHNHS